MTKMERAFKALDALPEEQRNAIVEMVLDLAEGATRPGMTPEQIDIAVRRAEDFRPGDPKRIERILDRS